MADHKAVYLIVEHGAEPNRQTFWRTAGVAYPCRDGSLNLKLDIHPGLTFNIRDPKSNGEREDAGDPKSAAIEAAETGSTTPNANGRQWPKLSEDDIPF